MWLGSLFLLLRPTAQATMRDAMMCAGHKRLTKGFEGHEIPIDIIHAGAADGIDIAFAKDAQSCAGADVIISFTNFSIKGVKPIHVISEVGNSNNMQWSPNDPKYSSELKQDTVQGVRGIMVQYSAAPLPDRKFLTWESYDTSNEKDMWIVASSWANSELQQLDKNQTTTGFTFFGLTQPVVAENCLSVYHVRETADGVYVVFSSMANYHPPFGLSQTFLSSKTWGRTIGYAQALQKQALVLAAMDQSLLWKPAAYLSPQSGISSTATGSTCSQLRADVGRSIGEQACKVNDELFQGLSAEVPGAMWKQFSGSPGVSSWVVAPITLSFAAITLVLVSRRWGRAIQGRLFSPRSLHHLLPVALDESVSNGDMPTCPE